jgi:predicted MFS family arabinose efflux permease
MTDAAGPGAARPAQASPAQASPAQASPAQASPAQASPAQARWAVAAIFFLVGLMLSAWFTQIPQFKSALALSDGELGVALLFPAAGALVSMQVAGRLARRFGSAPVLRVAGLAIAVTMPVLGSAANFGWFCAALAAFGLADGMLDVGMNAHAVAVERALRRPVLQSMHAAFSLGTIVGAISGGAAIYARVTPFAYLCGTAILAVVLALAAGVRLLPAQTDSDPAAGLLGRGRGPDSSRGWSGWSGFVVVLGLLGAGCLLAEGAAENWSAVFLRQDRHAEAALATAGYLVFTLVQFGGRVIGDRVHRWWGPVKLVRRGAAVAAAGLCLELTAPDPAWAIVGIGIYSLGLSGLVPIVFGAVGHGSAAEHGASGVTAAVARFTTLSYLGYLLGPAAIGWLAQGVGLTWALSSVLIILAAVIGFARMTSSALPDEVEPSNVEPSNVEPSSEPIMDPDGEATTS